MYSPDPADDTYTLKQLTYEVGENGKMETFVRPLHTVTFFNNTSVVQQMTVDPLAGVKESSLFMSDDERAFALLGDAVAHVAVPSALDDEGVITLGEAKWPYRSAVAELASSLNFRDTIAVPPHTRLTLTMNVYLNELDLLYTATFEGQPTGTVTTVKGRWKGVTVANVETQIEYGP